jgi:hypothetical protein
MKPGVDPGSLYKKTCLYRNTSPVSAPRTPEQGYQFSEDMADQTIAWINSVNATNPNKPWFVYLATPGVHEPHQAPKAYRDKYKGKFDSNRPNPLAGRTSFTYGPGVAYIQESAAINTHQGFSITAEIERGAASADGVLAALGGKTSGWSLDVTEGRPTFYSNFFGLAGYRAQSSTPCSRQARAPCERERLWPKTVIIDGS